jgi:PAS domain S-box-containing protein
MGSHATRFTKRSNAGSISMEDVATDIFMNIEDGILLLDDTAQIIQANHAAQSLLHLPQGEPVNISDIFTAYDNAREYKNEELVINRHGEAKIVTLSHATALQSPRLRGKIVIVRDITASKTTEKALQDGKTKLENLAAELAQANASLEQKVVERTKSLLHSNEQLRQEIAERERAEAALAAEKERLAVTLSSIGDGVITTDTTGNVTLLNKVAEQLTGWSQTRAVHRPLEEVFRIVDEKTRMSCPSLAQDVLQTHTIVHRTRHIVLIAADGTEHLIAESGAPICAQDGTVLGAVLAFRDMTETRKIEEELMKADRLEAIGVLAGGIAHDFNNILTAILGNITLAKLYAEQDEKTMVRLTNTEKAALRAQALTQQLLTIAKGGTPSKKPSSITELLQDSIAFSLRGSNVRCELHLPPDLWVVDVDEGQISQVINNLIINADQAMPDGGIIEVSAENIGLHKGCPDCPSALQKGNYVKISIRDEGSGIAEEHLQKLFDPYFTTKQHGSGLGLFTSYSIIKKHDGFIDVQSEPGVGTTFSIYLPASSTPVVSPTPPDITPNSGTGKILVMEDEESLRDVVGNTLSHYGYDVAFAQNGDEAITAYRQHKNAGQPFDVVIMDLTIPGGMGGKETVAKLLAIDPDAKAIIASGYANDPIMTAFKEYGFCGRVTKPYEARELHKILHDIIAGHSMTPTT